MVILQILVKSCPFWKDGTTNEGIGCAYPGPIDHCKAFKKMREEEERKVDFADKIRALPPVISQPPEMTGEWIPVPPERSGEWITIQTQGEAIISSAVSNIPSTF